MARIVLALISQHGKYLVHLQQRRFTLNQIQADIEVEKFNPIKGNTQHFKWAIEKGCQVRSMVFVYFMFSKSILSFWVSQIFISVTAKTCYCLSVIK